MKDALKKLAPVAKAVVAAGVAGTAAPGAIAITIPPEVHAPWYAYLIASALSAALTGLLTWATPNKPA